MEYILIDHTQNYNGRIVAEDALYWTLPIPVGFFSFDRDNDVVIGHIIEIRQEDFYLVGVTDTFNGDPDFYDLAIKLTNIKSEIVNNVFIIKRGQIRAAIIQPLPGWPAGMLTEK